MPRGVRFSGPKVGEFVARACNCGVGFFAKKYRTYLTSRCAGCRRAQIRKSKGYNAARCPLCCKLRPLSNDCGKHGKHGGNAVCPTCLASWACEMCGRSRRKCTISRNKHRCTACDRRLYRQKRRENP